MFKFDVIVLGAGAAGLMCAISAGRRGRRVLLLDHAREAGAKILISGGGRCNFTNTGCVPDRFLSGNPHFSRSALSRFSPGDFVEMVRRHGIAFHEKTLGQLFCDGSARQIVGMLLAECEAAGVALRLRHRVTAVSRPDAFRMETDQGAFEAGSLVLATGGLSIPKMGATGLTYELARQFGLRLTQIRPGLVPLTFADDTLALMRPLSGVSLECVASIGKRAFREAMLFTHHGLSGPAVLQISSYWRRGAGDAGPAAGAGCRGVPAGAQAVAAEGGIARRCWPRRCRRAWPLLWPSDGSRMADQADRLLAAVAARLTGWTVTPEGTEGFAKAEVTCGGVDTRDLSSRTMEANAVPGLFVIGEAVDVTGWLGGYNFQWAWASGWCAGQAA